MLTIVLADDEAFIRNGLKEMILQLEGGYSIVAEAANGQEALEAVEALRPDLVITDIKMPRLSGNELVAELERSYPDVEKLVLSGYDDFQLVRENFKNGVYDYLVKPIDKGQLAALLRQIEEKLRQRKAQSDERVSERIKLNESFPLLREQFLAKLLAGAYGEAAAAEKLGYYQIDWGVPPWRVLEARICHYRSWADGMGEDNARIHLYIVRNIVEDTLAEAGAKLATVALEGSVVAVAGALPPDSPDWPAVLRRVAANLGQYAKVPVQLADGGEAGGVAGLRRCREAARLGLQHAFYGENSSVTLADRNAAGGKPFAEPSFADLVDATAFALHDGIEKGHAVTVKELMTSFRDKVREKRPLPSLAVQAYADLYARLTYERETMRELFLESFGPAFSFEGNLRRYDTLVELNRYAADVFAEAAARGASLLGRKEKRWVEVAKQFIADHLGEELTLQRVADVVFLNPNYLSDLFRKEAGETFIDYVTRKRIEKAKDYLRHSSARSFEVAEMVGYRDSAYFSKVFKKVVGMSPSDYRNQAI